MKRNRPLGTPPRVTYRVMEAARATGMSRSKIFDLIKTGELASTKLGGTRLIYADSLRNLLRVEEMA